MNCGEEPYACACVPWCWEHDCPREWCLEKPHRPEPESKAALWVVIGLLLLSAAIVVYHFL